MRTLIFSDLRLLHFKKIIQRFSQGKYNIFIFEKTKQ